MEARRLYQHATELDPNYASPYGMAAWCILFGKANGWLAEPEREIAEGVRLARRAADASAPAAGRPRPLDRGPAQGGPPRMTVIRKLAAILLRIPAR